MKPSDLLSPQDALRFLPGVKSHYSLQWLLRHRHENGLVSSGAVVETRARPGSSRVRLMVNLPLMVQWLARGGATQSDAGPQPATRVAPPDEQRYPESVPGKDADPRDALIHELRTRLDWVRSTLAAAPYPYRVRLWFDADGRPRTYPVREGRHADVSLQPPADIPERAAVITIPNPEYRTWWEEARARALHAAEAALQAEREAQARTRDEMLAAIRQAGPSTKRRKKGSA